MSGFRLIPSGFTSGSDEADSPGIRGVMTHSGTALRYRCPVTVIMLAILEITHIDRTVLIVQELGLAHLLPTHSLQQASQNARAYIKTLVPEIACNVYAGFYECGSNTSTPMVMSYQ